MGRVSGSVEEGRRQIGLYNWADTAPIVVRGGLSRGQAGLPVQAGMLLPLCLVEWADVAVFFGFGAGLENGLGDGDVGRICGFNI